MNNMKSRETTHVAKLFLILLTLLLLLTVFPQSTSASSEWWDGSYRYNKGLYITNPAEDYQMRVNISYDAVLDGNEQIGCDSHCNTNFSDLRFVSNNTDICPHWIEHKVDSDYALVWIKTSGESTIRMYYGKPISASNSSGTDTWIYYEDWTTDNTGSYSNKKWSGDSDREECEVTSITNFDLTTGKRVLFLDTITYKTWNNYDVAVKNGFLTSADDYRDSLIDFYIEYAGDTDWGMNDNQVAVRLNTEHQSNESNTTRQILTWDNNSFKTIEITGNTSLLNMTIKDGQSDTTSIYSENISENITSSTLTYKGYGSNHGSGDSGSDHYWEYNNTFDAIRWGAHNAGRSTVKTMNKYTCIGKWEETEPTFSSFGDEQEVSVLTLSSTVIDATTASIYGQNNPNSNATCGFWIGNQTTSSSSFEQNISVAGTYSPGASFNYTLAGLDEGKYYHVRAWSSNTTSFDAATNESYFLTYPNPPSSFTASYNSPSSLLLTWTNATTDATNKSVYIRYSTASIPTTLTSGIELVNISSDHYLVEGLEINTQYYFTAWTYINDSHSPILSTYSTDYVWTQRTTSGGSYNISIKWENASYHNVNLTRGAYHSLIVTYTNYTQYNYWNSSGELSYNETMIISHDDKNGLLTINATDTPLFLTFTWNDTSNQTYSCRRINVIGGILDNETDITFYVRTNLPVYGISTAFLNDSLIPYSYSFEDKTGLFMTQAGIDAYTYIYTYSNDGTRQYIHEEFWDATDQIYPWLIYDKTYFFGVASSQLIIDQAGVVSVSSTTDPQLIIDYQEDETYFVDDYISIFGRWMAGGTGLYTHYIDSSTSTVSVNFSVFYLSNDTFRYGKTVYNDFNENFSYLLADQSTQYYVNITFDNTLFFENKTVTITFLPDINTSFDAEELDDLLNLILGDPAVRNQSGDFVPWLYVVIAIIAFIILVSFNEYHAAGSIVLTGIWLMGAGAFFTGLSVIGFLSGAILMAIGFLLITLGIAATLGGYR